MVGRGVPAEPEQELPMKCAEKKRSSLLALPMVFPDLSESRGSGSAGGFALPEHFRTSPN